MPIARIQMPDGRIARFEVPDGTTPEQAQSLAQQALVGQAGSPASAQPEADTGGWIQTAKDALAGAVRGAGSLGALLRTDVRQYDPRTGQRDATPIRQRMQSNTDAQDAALRDLGADTNSTAYAIGKVGAEIAGTAGIGGAGVAALRSAAPALASAKYAAPVLRAVETGGMSSGTVGGLSGLGVKAAGGAVAGAAAAKALGQSDEDTAQAAALGGFLPIGFGAAGRAAAGATGLIKPLMGSGQREIVGDLLRQYSHDPKAALAALQSNAGRQIVPGSVPLTSAAAGDIGLSGLTRTMQSANSQMANELGIRAANQNAARTGLLERMVGTQAERDALEAARRAASAPLREKVLNEGRMIDAGKVTDGIEQMMADPNNAGATARAALDRVRKQIADITTDTGQIHPRALYEIRKDIGLAMQGKLQGDAGNLRYARGVLDRVQSMLDDQISASARKTPGTDIVVRRANDPLALPGSQGPSAAPVADPWRQYLANYAEASKPLNQMDQLAEVFRRVQTGTVDLHGNAIISAAKLNNLLKNEGDDLAKVLTKDQLQRLRAVASDLNAGRLGLEAGKALGSNTAQNVSQTWLLNRVLGRYGESPVVSSVMKKPLGLLYGSANEQITDQLGQALLDPDLARRLLEESIKRATPRGGLLSPPAHASAVRGLLTTD